MLHKIFCHLAHTSLLCCEGQSCGFCTVKSEDVADHYLDQNKHNGHFQKLRRGKNLKSCWIASFLQSCMRSSSFQVQRLARQKCSDHILRAVTGKTQFWTSKSLETQKMLFSCLNIRRKYENTLLDKSSNLCCLRHWGGNYAGWFPSPLRVEGGWKALLRVFILAISPSDPSHL